jgi:osmoprotectant transport system ATP-binding protein
VARVLGAARPQAPARHVLIVVRHVSKRYGSVVALDDVSLEVPARTTHVLLGSSGSGKSTLVRLILGLVTPDAGDVVVAGVGVTPASRQQLVGQVGYVVQEGGLYPHLTAAGNVSLPAEAAGWPRQRIAARLGDLAALVALHDGVLQRYPSELSGGQRQRIGLMRALMLDPPVLLLDEPLGALDPIVRAGLQNELRHIFVTLGKTVVLVTHDVREAVLFGGRITLLRDGRVVQQGPFADLVKRPVEPFVSDFLLAQAPPAELRQYF